MAERDLEQYELIPLLENHSYRDHMMDFRGPVSETFECAPEHSIRTVRKLDESYEGAFPDKWRFSYDQDGESILFSAQKSYDTVEEFADAADFTVDPSHRTFVSPKDDRGLEVEIRGMLEVGPDELYRTLI